MEVAQLKGTPPSKPAGKKDKDGKGGKKGRESKVGKGHKGDLSGEQSSGVIGRTAWPPCAALSSLVDVIATGDMSQVKNIMPCVEIGLRSTVRCFSDL